jgi:hypothetical protein
LSKKVGWQVFSVEGVAEELAFLVPKEQNKTAG